MPTTLAAPLPDLDLEQASILVIDTGDANAVITGLVIHVSQTVPAIEQRIDLIPPLLTHVPSGTEAPGAGPGG